MLQLEPATGSSPMSVRPKLMMERLPGSICTGDMVRPLVLDAGGLPPTISSTPSSMYDVTPAATSLSRWKSARTVFCVPR